MRLVHLAPASTERTIRRGGLKGAKANLVTSPGGSVTLAKAVYAMPVVADFWTTFQWLRELRRGHDERLVAVYFRVPDSELVHCGRYSEPHTLRTATAAASWVRKNPAGAQIVLPRSVAAKDVVSIKQMKQLVGWTEIPEASRKFACICSACLPRGNRQLMRRVHAAFAAGLAAARRATSDAERLAALSSLDLPLERGRDRLDLTKLLGFVRAPNPKVRRAAAQLLSYFRISKVQGYLESLLEDPHLEVRQQAVEALVRAGDAVRAAKLLAKHSGEVVSYLVEMLEFEDDSVALEVLERFAGHPDVGVQETVESVARSLLPDFRGSASARRRLEAIIAKI